MDFTGVDTSITVGPMIYTAMSFIGLHGEMILLGLAILYVPVIIGMLFYLTEKPKKATKGKGKKGSGSGRKRSGSGTRRSGGGRKRSGGGLKTVRG